MEPTNGTDQQMISQEPPQKLAPKHKVKDFADDLTIISSSSNDHAEALKYISDSCQDSSKMCIAYLSGLELTTGNLSISG